MPRGRCGDSISGEPTSMKHCGPNIEIQAARRKARLDHAWRGSLSRGLRQCPSRPSRSNVSRNHATRVIVVDPDQPDPTALDTAAEILRRGGLVAFATETVYGLGAIATDPAAVSRIFAAKERPAINPVIVHVAGVAQARDCVAEWPATAQTSGRAILARSPHARPQPVRESSPIR